MQPSSEVEVMLNKIGLTYVETIADRRGSVVMRVKRGRERFTLKLHMEDGTDIAAQKSELLLREAAILAEIPHLTRKLYVDHGTSGAQNWLLLREVAGGEVHQEAKRIRETVADQGLKVGSLLKLLGKVSAFYDALYIGGYLHGDVQPAHTYIEQDEITIIDWGLARKIEEPNPLYKGGFAYFVAPEIAARMLAKDAVISYTPQSEVYALGATLFMFYTGGLGLDLGIAKSQLREAPIEKKLQRVVENRIFSFEELGADPYPQLETLLRKCLSTSPGGRFADPTLVHQSLIELRNS